MKRLTILLTLALSLWGCQPPGVSAKASGEATSDAAQSAGTIIINCLQVVGQSSKPGQNVYCIERTVPGSDTDILRGLK